MTDKQLISWIIYVYNIGESTLIDELNRSIGVLWLTRTTFLAFVQNIYYFVLSLKKIKIYLSLHKWIVN